MRNPKRMTLYLKRKVSSFQAKSYHFGLLCSYSLKSYPYSFKSCNFMPKIALIHGSDFPYLRISLNGTLRLKFWKNKRFIIKEDIKNKT